MQGVLREPIAWPEVQWAPRRFYGQTLADRLFQTLRPARDVFFCTNRPYAFLHLRPHVIPFSCFLRSFRA
jgi:hypothetical protein